MKTDSFLCFSFGAVDKKLVEREQQSLERRMREKQCAASATSTTAASVELLPPSYASANEESEYDSDINVNCANKCKHLRTIVSAKLSSTLDRTNTCVCTITGKFMGACKLLKESFG